MLGDCPSQDGSVTVPAYARPVAQAVAWLGGRWLLRWRGGGASPDHSGALPITTEIMAHKVSSWRNLLLLPVIVND